MQIPAVYSVRDYVGAGGLISYGTDVTTKRTARTAEWGSRQGGGNRSTLERRVCSNPTGSADIDHHRIGPLVLLFKIVREVYGEVVLRTRLLQPSARLVLVFHPKAKMM